MPLPYLAAQLRQADPALYLLSLFAPADRREAIWALFLFKHEIAKVRVSVSETTLGLIRLQWWRDEIAKIYAGETGGQNPILSTLAPAIKKHDLPHEHFETLIYAHEFDLEDMAPPNREGLRHYADFTTTPLLLLALQIAGEREQEGAIRQIAIDYALLEIVRRVPEMLAQRRCYLPQDDLAALNLAPQKVIDFNHKKEIVEIVSAIVLTITSYRKADSALLRKFSAFNEIMLNYLMKNDFDVFSVKVQALPPFLALRLAFS